MQDRGARSGQSHDEHGLHHLDGGDLGVLLAVVHVVESVDDVQQHPLLGDEAADVVEACFGIQRVDEEIHPLEELSGPEVSEAASALLAFGEQRVAVEGRGHGDRSSRLHWSPAQAPTPPASGRRSRR